MQKIVTYTDFVTKLKDIFSQEVERSVLYLPTTEYKYQKANSVEDFTNIPFTYIRMIEPLKTFLFKPKEDLIHLPSTAYQSSIYILGTKSCDISALKVLDNVFLNKDYVDTNYKFWREKVVLISSDCPKPTENCFCSFVNGTPYPTTGFDINISFLDENNFIIESGSKKGEQIIEKYFKDFDEPTKNDIAKRDSIRALSVRKIKDFNKEYIEEKKDEYYKIVKTGSETDTVWKKESELCVQCLGCNFICPSCYCFFIRESSEYYEKQSRDRVWDSCHSTGYSRVAGGANPRKFKHQRFKNRYQCKFVYRKDNFGFYGCTGCGRCIEVCPGKIDIRKVVRSLVIAKGEEVLV